MGRTCSFWGHSAATLFCSQKQMSLALSECTGLLVPALTLVSTLATSVFNVTDLPSSAQSFDAVPLATAVGAMALGLVHTFCSQRHWGDHRLLKMASDFSIFLDIEMLSGLVKYFMQKHSVLPFRQPWPPQLSGVTEHKKAAALCGCS